MKTCCSFPAFPICLILLFTSCNQKNKSNEQKKDTTFFDPIELGAFNQTSNLSIEARFTECGEWGGHKETIIVNADKDQTLSATYKVYPFNCDSLDHYYGNKSLTPIVEKRIILNDQKKQSIIDYTQRLVQSRVAQRFPTSNANNIFSIVNSDSTLVIRVYGSKEYETDSFKKLVSELLN